MQTDAAVCQRLKEANDDSRQPHTIDHRLFAEQESGLISLKKICAALGFRPGDVRPVSREGGQVEYWLTIQDVMPADMKLLARFSLLMQALGEAFGCKYDGWGTQTVPQIDAEAPPPAD